LYNPSWCLKKLTDSGAFMYVWVFGLAKASNCGKKNEIKLKNLNHKLATLYPRLTCVFTSVYAPCLKKTTTHACFLLSNRPNLKLVECGSNEYTVDEIWPLQHVTLIRPVANYFHEVLCDCCSTVYVVILTFDSVSETLNLYLKFETTCWEIHVLSWGGVYSLKQRF